MLSYEFFRCTFKDKNSSKRIIMPLNLSFCNNATTVIILHVQRHTWKVTILHTRDSLPRRWNTICTYQAFYFTSWGKKRNFHCSSVWLPEAASSTTPSLCWLRNPSIFPLHTPYFFTCHCTKSKLFYKKSWPQHHDTPLQGAQTSSLCQRGCGKQSETDSNSQKHCGKPGGLHRQKLIQNNLYRHIHLKR